MQLSEEELSELRKKSTEKMTDEEKEALPTYDKAIRGLIYDPSIYDAEWFAMQEWQHPWCQKIMGWFVGEFGPFESSLDLGAGDGYYSHVLAEMKTEAIAIEVSEEALPAMSELIEGMVHDLREPLDLEREFDLILCLEVAEHLPEESADVLCDTIAQHCGGLILFTAATPKQGGHGHCNLQPFEFWHEKFSKRGLQRLEEATEKVKQGWLNILGESLPWLTRNVVLYRKGE